jgi:hypothetical protein
MGFPTVAYWRGVAYLHDPLNRAHEKRKEFEKMVSLGFFHDIPPILLPTNNHLFIVKAVLETGTKPSIRDFENLASMDRSRIKVRLLAIFSIKLIDEEAQGLFGFQLIQLILAGDARVLCWNGDFFGRNTAKGVCVLGNVKEAVVKVVMVTEAFNLVFLTMELMERVAMKSPVARI